MQLTPNELTPNDDLDALRRAVKWSEGYQRREPQIVVMSQPMPDEGTPQWIEEATRLACIAQSVTLGLQPWQCEPALVHDGGVVDDSCYGRRSNEVELRRKMIRLGISVWEPDPASAIARIEHDAA